jgi:hypothetical protein
MKDQLFIQTCINQYENFKNNKISICCVVIFETKEFDIMFVKIILFIIK